MRKLSLVLLVVLSSSVALNLFVLLGMSRYKQKVELKFDITKREFNHSVYIAVSNYLSSIRGSVTVETNKVTNYTVSAKPIPATIYPDYYRGQWVLLSDGVRYREGDFFGDAVIEFICEDKVYCRSGSSITVYRPSPVRDVGSAGARTAKAENSQSDARALD